MTEQWLIVSWKYNGYLDDCYGKLIDTVEGTQEEATKAARKHIDFYAPVGIVKVIQR